MSATVLLVPGSINRAVFASHAAASTDPEVLNARLKIPPVDDSPNSDSTDLVFGEGSYPKW